jgi:hypothetical protein
MTETAAARALKTIENCTDVKGLQRLAANARKIGELAVAHAADLRRYEILPAEKPGTFEHDVWRSIHALEGTLSLERGRTTRLGRTRQKITRVGELQTVKDLVLSTKPSDGFSMLIDRDMAKLTFEWLSLRHPDRFDSAVLEAAATRLHSVGINAPQ